MTRHAYGHPYDPNCPHCTPAMLDVETGKPLADDHPAMKIIMRVWNSAPFEQRRAYLAVTADNSRDPRDLALMGPLVQRMQDAMKNSEKN
jgi:hypothetical protein